MQERVHQQSFDFAPGYKDKTLGVLGGVYGSAPLKTQDILKASSSSPLLDAPIGSADAEDQAKNLVLQTMRDLGVDYGDMRLGRDINRTLALSDENIVSHSISKSEGIGIRVLCDGFWGFASTDQLTSDGIARCVKRAVSMARAVGKATPAQLRLTPDQFASEPVHKSEWHTPIHICPFSISTLEAATPLQNAANAARKLEGIKRVSSYLVAYGRRRLFANTEGSNILKTHAVCDSLVRIYAVNHGTSSYRTMTASALAGGFEHILAFDYPGKAEEAAREALLKCTAKAPDLGNYTLILDGHNLGLTMHESVGHPTELDRVLGYELGFAGGSFASVDKLNHFQYGSPIVNFTANNKILFGGASVGFDDEGVECSSFPIIREGFLVGYGTNRETAHKIGQSRANGTCRSTHWYDAPIVRIPNLFLEPGKDRLSLDTLIGDTTDGILMLGRDSFSIDQMRYNFQFGADMCYRIKNGKITEPLKDVIYQSISPEFWNSCDAICDESEWQMHGVFNCGKGQPIQTAKMMHGAAPARFRNIKVGF